MLAGISAATSPVLYLTGLSGKYNDRFIACKYNGEIYKGKNYDDYQYGDTYFENIPTAAIKNGKPGILCEDGTFFEEEGESLSNEHVIFSDSNWRSYFYQQNKAFRTALTWAIIISIISIVIFWLYMASSRRNRKRLFKDVGEIIIKANQ